MPNVKSIERILTTFQNEPYNTQEVSDAIGFVKKKIPTEKIETLKKKYLSIKEPSIESKYLDVDKFLSRYVRRAVMLDLHQQKNLSIVDIATGAGYFPFACQALGHQAQAIDVNTSVIYNEMIQALQVNRTHHFIEPYKKLPDVEQRFHVVTAFAVSFDRYYENENNVSRQSQGTWNLDEWKFFIEDLMEHYLLPKGLIWICLNEREGKTYRQDLPAWIKSIGGVALGKDLLIQR